MSVDDPQDPEFSLFVPEKRKAIASIKQLNFRATPKELSEVSGLSINTASFWLNKIAGETRGALEVAADGTVFYSFTPHFTNAYLQRGLRKTALIVGVFLFNLLYWVVRMSFGFALALSLLVIVLIFVALIAMAIAAIFGDDSGDGGFDLGGFDFFDLRFLLDLFSWSYSPSHTYYPNSIPSVRRDKYNEYVQEHPKGNFFLDCFSFLFGDGRPNSNLQDIRWAQIARVIKAYGGVVSAEQLAPFLDGDQSDSGMILNALAQFNGHPEVTRSGYIVYVFPDFMNDKFVPPIANVRSEPYLHEDGWKFSALPTHTIIVVTTLAFLNFAGSWWLFGHIASIHMLHTLAIVIDVLLTYAIVFLAIPAVRIVAIWVLNERIRQRNNRRLHAFELLNNPSVAIRQEIEEAREIKVEQLSLMRQDKRIIYTSEKDSIEQKFEEPS